MSRRSRASGPRRAIDSVAAAGDVYLCSPGFEHDLSREVQSGGGRPTVFPGGIVSAGARPVVDPVFARQVLPRARLLEGIGPTALADAILEHAGPQEGALLSGRSIVQVFAPDFLRRGSSRPEPHPLSRAVSELASLLQRKIEGRARKKAVASTSTSEGHQWQMQVLLIDGWRAWCSLHPCQETAGLSSWPSLFPGGRAPVAGHEDAPSSAYRKLVEGLAWVGSVPREFDLVLDLGAAPGGWTYVALAEGARVHAYDRADLDPKLARHPRLTHRRQDAYSCDEFEQATWLICDVIDVPGKTLALVERALATPSLQAMVVTIKLKATLDHGVLVAAKTLADSGRHLGWSTRVKHLVHNKQEVTFLAKRAQS
ncbi:MAG: SAM-dependent methyltransferase [Myxococcota bacterium]